MKAAGVCIQEFRYHICMHTRDVVEQAHPIIVPSVSKLSGT